MITEILSKDTTGMPKIYKGSSGSKLRATKMEYLLKFSISAAIALIAAAINSSLVFNFDSAQHPYSYYFMCSLPGAALGVLTVDCIGFFKKRKSYMKAKASDEDDR